MRHSWEIGSSMVSASSFRKVDGDDREGSGLISGGAWISSPGDSLDGLRGGVEEIVRGLDPGGGPVSRTESRTYSCPRCGIRVTVVLRGTSWKRCLSKAVKDGGYSPDCNQQLARGIMDG